MILFKDSKTLPFWLLTFAVITALVVSQLIQDGVFMDGMLYISVSKNLADGLGTFWNPHFSQTSMSSFHEQPPLYFGLLALFYKVFGSSMYVERLFCFVCYSITAVYIHKIWKKIYYQNTEIAENSWLPILFWTSIPVCFWAYTNHVEETVMAVFAVASVYYIFCALFLKENVIYNLLLAGVFIFLSSLTKGIQGLFPIVAVGAYWLTARDISFRKMIVYSSILVGVPILIYSFLLIFSSEVYDSFKNYFEIRLVGTFHNKGATTQNRFELLIRLFWELLPITGISVIFLFFTRKSKVVDVREKLHNSIVFWFILIGSAGSLPLMVTLEQRGFYLVTVLPFFAIPIAMWIAPRLTVLTNKINSSTLGFKFFKISSIVLLIAALAFTYSNIGNAKRDKDLLSDVYAIGKIVPHGDFITIPSDMWNDYNMVEYFVRYFYISCDGTNAQHKYFILRKELSKNLVPENFKRYPLETKKIDLYENKE